MNVQTTELPAPQQGNLTAGERVDRAMSRFADGYDALTALRLESCIHCGMCADACHFFIATEDPKYTPILKVEPLKQAYKREAGAFALLYRMLGLKRAVTAEELEQWQELLFDSCNLCGRCSLICPMGIDVAALIEQTRRGMFDAGLAPPQLYDKARRQAESGRLESQDPPYADQLRKLARERGFEIPMDRDRAEILVCISELDLDRNPQGVEALVRVLEHIGADYTFSSKCLIAENYAYLAGGKDWQREISQRVIDAAKACEAKTVVLPECGHAYTALRWEAAELKGERLPFAVQHITELLAEAYQAGKLKVRKANGASVTFHDPCQIVRKGGAEKPPRILLEAMGVELKELENRAGFTFCCGGGGGVLDIDRAKPLRYRAMQPKLREIDATGADELVVTCSGCRETFRDAAEHFDWNKLPHSLLEMVAAHLEETGGRS